MSSTLGLGLLIVMWVVVLAPLLVRNQRPIRKITDAFEKTRVVYQGGSDALPTPRRPRLLPKDVRPATPAEDAELVDPRDVIVEDTVRGADIDEQRVVLSVVEGQVEPDSDSSVPAAADADTDSDAAAASASESESEAVAIDAEPADAAEAQPTLVSVEDVEDEYADSDYAARYFTADSVEYEEYEEDGELVRRARFAYDEAYVGPADVLHPEADYEPYPEVEQAPAPQEDLGELELTEEDRAFAASRRSRTAFNPEREAAQWAQLKKRRQRSLVGFAVAVVLSVIVAGVLGGWFWLLPVVAAGLAVMYMVALRKQVLVERQLRAQRIARLRRQRLGVRTGAHSDSAAGLPSRLRRPGAIVVEVDDDSPDFDELDVVFVEDAVDVEFTPAPPAQVRAV